MVQVYAHTSLDIERFFFKAKLTNSLEININLRFFVSFFNEVEMVVKHDAKFALCLTTSLNF